ncbi:DNA-processing protein DprA [Candidatus Poriferisodalis sp.]|uniref:DNA-processing protein DprA n=1 Tax=Candidatus Poriferisodalis sp. TaxID=3101277 RepID=UPI003D150DBB
MNSVDVSEVLEDEPLLAALCEELVTFMNGSNMGRLTFLLDELMLDPSGSHLDESDYEWLQDGVRGAAQRRDAWTREILRLADEGVSVVTSTGPGYPVNLTLVHDGPPLLFVKGDLCEQDRRAVAVVGTRVASKIGLDLAQLISGPSSFVGMRLG